MTVFSDPNAAISSGVPAITIGIFLLMFSEMLAIKLNYKAQRYSVLAGFSFVILAVTQILGNFLFLLEGLPLVEYFIDLVAIITFTFFLVGVGLLGRLAFEIWRELGHAQKMEDE